MSGDDAGPYISQMHGAACDALTFLGQATREDFFGDRKTQQAIVMSLMIVGEAAARTIEKCPNFVASHPVIPWVAMRGLRNRIAHAYFQVDMEIVWQTTQSALPALIAQLRSLDGSS